MSKNPRSVLAQMEANKRAGRPLWQGIGDGPCAIGGEHTKAAFNGMVYCEHRVSAHSCDRCMGRPDTYDPVCETCGVPKEKHTDMEAAYCVTRQIAEATDKPVYVAGRPTPTEF